MLSALLAFFERNPPVIRGLLPQRAGNAEIWYLMFLEQTVVTGDLRRYVDHVMSRWCTSVKSLQMARRLGKSKWNLVSMVWKGNFALNKKNSFSGFTSHQKPVYSLLQETACSSTNWNVNKKVDIVEMSFHLTINLMFRYKFHWSLLTRFQLTIIQHFSTHSDNCFAPSTRQAIASQTIKTGFNDQISMRWYHDETIFKG